MHWSIKFSLGVLLLASVALVLQAVYRTHNLGPAVKTTYPNGEIVSAVSGRGTQFVIKLNDTDETLVVRDTVLLPLPAGTNVPLERREFADGTVRYKIIRNR
ncbi:hypothetical protein RB623_03735 [Mesorhizobium sp. LHD-90]|uniref:hypothetical protein n=1 Tax=Mesorhizobium sp. LHD-90 TaxID=3071414 RepID=UPI0027E1F355|nr:hypothetical protein [Mesorhizobium sp. LHD-90]MDQ6433159.1 hypothetical protein [Mesorhizobium sp. LHD-90]